MRLFERSHTYKHDWESVTAAHWPHVNCVHTVNREVNHEENSFRVRRLMMVDFSLPRWIQKAAGISGAGIGMEEAFCDGNKKKLTLVQQNYTFSSMFTTLEICTYEPHPENPNWTLFTQKAEYRVHGLGKLGGPIESAACGGAEGKSKEGACVMEEIIHRVKSGVDEMKHQVDEMKHQVDEKIHQLDDRIHHFQEDVERKVHDVEKKLHDAVEQAEIRAEKAVFLAKEKAEKMLHLDQFKVAQAESPSFQVAHREGKTGWRSWVSLTSWKQSLGMSKSN